MTPQSDTPTVESRVAAFADEDHFLTECEDQTKTVKGRHERSVSTSVDDDTHIVVHTIIDTCSPEAAMGSVSWKTQPRELSECPYCEGDVDSEVSRTNYDETTGAHTQTITVECQNCPFRERTQTEIGGGYPRTSKPVFRRQRVPHDWETTLNGLTLSEVLKDSDISRTDAANLMRELYLDKVYASPGIRDKAYDSDSGEIETTTCGCCETGVDAPATTTHPYYGEVCSDCEDASAWDISDAELPTDLTERLSEYESVTRERIRTVLRDVSYYHLFRAHESDDKEVDDFEPGIPTGKGGKRAVQLGTGEPGTGLRRPKGALYDFRWWRQLLITCHECGLITRRDDLDCEDTDPNATWSITEKGESVLDELSHCETCSKSLSPFVKVSLHLFGNHTNSEASLTLGCPNCRTSENISGATTIRSSGESQLIQLEPITDI